MDDDCGRASVAPKPLLVAVRAAVSRHRLVRPGDRVLVAVSGGPDSVALLHALTLLRPEYGLALHVCHVHHGLRPEADRDAQFVERLAARLGCPITVERVAVTLGSGRSPEQAARVARYAALARAARVFDASRIALGHTADDQAETVLMRVLQGAGPRGLAGMLVRRGLLVRPLLDVDRATVLAHLATHGLPSVEDATNRDPRFLRNRIRHELLPLLAAHAGPRIGQALRRVGRASREAVEALDALLRPRAAGLLRPGPGGWAIDLAALRELPAGAVKVLLRIAILEVAPAGELRAGLRSAHLTALCALLESPLGARVRLPGGLVVERAREALWIVPRMAPPCRMSLSVPGETPVPGLRIMLLADAVPPSRGCPTDPAWEAWFDVDALPAGLEVRPRAPGDRIVPFGGDRPIRVSRLLAAAGTPRLARARWPILVARHHAGEEVLWVIGVRRAAAAAITPETRAMLRVRAVSDPLESKREELT